MKGDLTMSLLKNLEESFIFKRGMKVEGANFTGDAWFEPLIPYDGFNETLIYNVTFAPNARNFWHTHPGGQILLVTAGEGWYQEKGKPAQRIKAGDAIRILPNVEHWHGATSDSWMVHIGETVMPGLGDTWFTGEKVTDEYYSKLREDTRTDNMKKTEIQK